MDRQTDDNHANNSTVTEKYGRLKMSKADLFREFS